MDVEKKRRGSCHVPIIEALCCEIRYIRYYICIYFIRNVTSLRTRTSGCSCWRYNYGGPRWWHALSTRRLGKGVQYLYKAWMKMLPAIHSHLSHKRAHEANLPEESRGKIGNVFVSRQKDFAPRWVAQPCSRTTRFPLETFKFHFFCPRALYLGSNKNILTKFLRRRFGKLFSFIREVIKIIFFHSWK